MIPVSFESNGVHVVGNLYVPDNLSVPAPGVITIGPMTYAKEQAPTQYAKRLAARGFVALAFDPRYRGESEGTPRDYENPLAKVEDLKNAVTFLSSRSEVDMNRIVALAICQGSSEMLRAAADDDRIKVLVTVAGHYRDHDADLVWLGEEGLAHRRERGAQAKAAFERTGEVTYVPAIDPVRTDVGMPGKFVWDWYHPWAEAGIWENRYAVLSDADLLAYESASAAARMQQPYLMIHSDNCFIPDAARRQFALVPQTEKKLLWEGKNQHFQYYDDPVVIDHAVESITDWFAHHLS